ncbi:hypothetical protein ES332_A07G104800v1 [Gossypium tomentosum]|nr:hypothetical protein ES332_A07G104800v1 [Gossypium tomentosum]
MYFYCIGVMATEFIIFYEISLLKRYDTLSIDNEREHVCSHSYMVMDAYKRALYRCHVICTCLSWCLFAAIASRSNQHHHHHHRDHRNNEGNPAVQSRRLTSTPSSSSSS